MKRCAAESDGTCRHPLQGGAASAERCARCPNWIGPPRGLGDVVHLVAQATRIDRLAATVAPDCRCAERRAALNAAVPFADKGG